ncbi:MAG: GMC family oxidoreductase N-terminal domain-containing protein [Deltaproteobacteria bacterium]|nr:GMC family oxidoreductase N-terminal domain-containing protein [Deltaproteobacteria bacterium]
MRKRATPGAPQLAARPPEYDLEYPNVEDGRSLGRHPRGRHEFGADVVVVGSGAGGAPAARALRDAGFDVLLLEEGGLHLTESFRTDPITSLQRLYRDAGTSSILGRPPIMFAEGRCVGGSTVINGGMSWRTPEHALDHWSRELGLEATDSKSMEPWFDEAQSILHVEQQHPDTLGRNDELFVAGANQLGWKVETNPRNMHRCVGLNNCGFGCPTGAKRSMLVTEIPRALGAGARLLTYAKVDRVLMRGGRATGVRGHFVDERGSSRRLSGGRLGSFEVRARLVVLAAGARHTPGILMRSMVFGGQVGKGLHTHPNAKVVGVFDERVNPWIGAHQSHQIHQFLGDGILIGYAGVPPGILATGIPGFGRAHAERMAQFNHMITAACLIEDTGEGRVILGPDLQPWMTFRLSPRDVETVHRGVRLAAEQMFAAGARSVLLPFGDLSEIHGADQLVEIDRRPRKRHNIELMTVHIMSSARMGRDKAAGVVDAWGRVHGIDALTIADASIIPSSIGVNPQETIVALALRCAERWAGDLARRSAT